MGSFAQLALLVLLVVLVTCLIVLKCLPGILARFDLDDATSAQREEAMRERREVAARIGAMRQRFEETRTMAEEKRAEAETKRAEAEAINRDIQQLKYEAIRRRASRSESGG